MSCNPATSCFEPAVIALDLLRCPQCKLTWALHTVQQVFTQRPDDVMVRRELSMCFDNFTHFFDHINSLLPSACPMRVPCQGPCRCCKPCAMLMQESCFLA
jgi:hypothetical protein